ncbi:MAG: hypothetical protein PHT16_02085 [Candidatus Pacebacteria bacterium]|nr:hypothetical protein [Candidatus Paceibacterota bacterium]
MEFVNQPTYIFIKDLVTFILTIIGMIIAGGGLSTWKKQIKGTKIMEVSYNLNYSILKLRDAIKHVRNPAIWNAENYKAIQYFKNKYPEKIDNENMKKNSDIYVYEMRWEEITNAYTEMESHLLAAEVLWGSEILNKVKPLRKKVTELNIGLQQYLTPELRTKSLEKIDEIIYDTSNENEKDVFSQEIDKAVEEIGNYIKQKS